MSRILAAISRAIISNTATIAYTCMLISMYINAGIVASGINAFYTQVFFGLVIILSVIMQAVISKKIKR